MWTVALSLMLLQPPVGQTTAAKPTLNLPPQIQSMPGKVFVVKLDTNCKWVRWKIPAGLERVPPTDTAYGENAYVGYGPAGVYEFFVEGSLNDVHSDGKCVVFVGQPTPGPTPPGPTPPGPVPPRPPGPGPTDPFFAVLQEKYTADTGADKAASLVTLTTIYRTATKATIEDQSIQTSRQLFDRLRSTSKLLLADTALHPMREAIKVEVAKCSSADVALDATERAKISGCFARIASLLEAVR